MPTYGNPWAKLSEGTYENLRRDGKRLNHKWRKAVSFAINRAMRHNTVLPRHPSGFCFLEDLAHVVTVGGKIPRLPTQLELMQVISAEDIGRFEGTCIEENGHHASAAFSPAAYKVTAWRGCPTTPYTPGIPLA